jgi:putative ABC transport system substrate-binding protein
VLWSVLFFWLNETNQMIQINQINKQDERDKPQTQMNTIFDINRLFRVWRSLGAWATSTFLLRRTIRHHLRRARPETILNVFQRIHLRFFRACGLASGRTSFASSRTAKSDRLLAAWAVLGLVVMLSFCTLNVCESVAMDIAILQSSDIAAYREAIAGLKTTGPIGAIYTEYDAQGDLELGKKLARKLRASNASLVVAVGLKAALAAKVEIVDVPIVYMMILDPLKHQLTAANMTGTLLEVPVDRQLKIMRTFLPTLHQLGALYDPAKTSSRVKEAVQQATISDFQLKGLPVESDKDVPQQLRALLSDVEALWLIPDSTVLTNESIRFILESALARQIPVIGFSPEFTRLGALLSMSVNYGDVGRETGLLARRILDGERLLPLNPVPSERLKITVNLKTARFLGMTFPKELTSLIDETY